MVTPVIVMHNMKVSYHVAYPPEEETILRVIQSRIDKDPVIFILYSILIHSSQILNNINISSLA